MRQQCARRWRNDERCSFTAQPTVQSTVRLKYKTLPGSQLQTRHGVTPWAREELNLRPHAYQAAADRRLAPMGANFRDFWAFGTDERRPAPMGAGTVRVTVPSELTLRRIVAASATPGATPYTADARGATRWFSYFARPDVVPLPVRVLPRILHGRFMMDARDLKASQTTTWGSDTTPSCGFSFPTRPFDSLRGRGLCDSSCDSWAVLLQVIIAP